MTHYLEIDITDDIDDAISAVVSEIQEALEEFTKHRHGSVTRAEEVDIHQLLAKHHQIAHIWGVEDVREVRPDLTEEQAWQVLLACDKDLHSSLGITWDGIHETAEALYGPKPCEER